MPIVFSSSYSLTGGGMLREALGLPFHVDWAAMCLRYLCLSETFVCTDNWGRWVGVLCLQISWKIHSAHGLEKAFL